MPSLNHPRTRTHTLPDNRALFSIGRMPRRKSASLLPAAAADVNGRPTSSTRPAIAPPASAGSLFSDSTEVTAQTSLYPVPPTATPWSGTFLDAEPDVDADGDVAVHDDDGFHGSPESGLDLETDTVSASLPELRRRKKAISQPQPSLLRSTLEAKALPHLPQQEQPPTFLPPLPLHSNNISDSFISILDDSVFKQYHMPSIDRFDNDRPLTGHLTTSHSSDPAVLASTAAAAFSHTDTDTASGTDDNRLDEKPRSRNVKLAWLPPRSESLAVTNQTFWPPSLKKMEAVTIAVIGADGTGKSSFIQQAMRLPNLPTTGITGMRLNIDGKPFIVTMIELDLEHFDIDAGMRIRWPKSISGNKVPHIDGALMLYDVMNRDSVHDLPPTLAALHNSQLPTILVATKCDNPESSRQINADALAAVFPSILADFKTSATIPAITRDCLQAIVLAAVCKRKDAQSDSYHSFSFSSATTSNSNGNTARPAATAPTTNATTIFSSRRRAASSAAHLDAPPDSVNGRPLSGDQGSGRHSRASSDLSLLRGRPITPNDRESYYRSQNSRSPRVGYTSAPHAGNSSYGAEMTDEHITQSGPGSLRSSGERSVCLDTGLESFLDIEESEAESLRFTEDVPILQRNDENLFDKPAKAAGTLFAELVDRLLAAPITLADKNFADVFLCLYRKFAAPHELLRAIISSLDKTWGDRSAHFLERTATQFRYIEVIAHWASLYPGDFARPASKKLLEGLIWRLADETIFALSAQQLRNHLEHDIVENDDTRWAMCDDPPTIDPAASGSVATLAGDPGSEIFLSESMRSLVLEDSRSSDRPSSESGSRGAGLGLGTGNTSNSLSPRRATKSPQFQSCEDYEREAATLVHLGTLPLNKFRYHIFMDMDMNTVADEITRIDWIMFSSIRIRDLVRHVSLPAQEKERCRSFTNVNRMIAHFNHVAHWVSNMILIRDKAKHRAPCLQKFICIALRLRQVRNYNGLAAVLAGIGGSSVHRLAQTWALIDSDIQKRYARLVLLMSTQKSHFTYRLAWENSPLPRIPFMPLHRRDLVSAEEGSRTFVGPNGDHINWKKFEVLGDVLLPIMKSQGTPYPNLEKHAAIREMVLDCRIPMDEDETYQRSAQVEPSGATADMKKKFPWLSKQKMLGPIQDY